MRLDEIRIDWSNYREHAAREEEAGRIYDVIVASPRLGSYAELKNVPYKEARNRMIELAEDHFSSLFREDPRNTEKEWQNYDAIKVSNSTVKAITFYFLRDVSNKR